MHHNTKMDRASTQESLVSQFERRAQEYLRHVLSTSAELLAAVEAMVERANNAQTRSALLVASILDSNPAKEIEHQTRYSGKKRPYLYFRGFKQDVVRDGYGLHFVIALSGEGINTSFEPTDADWLWFLPKNCIGAYSFPELVSNLRANLPATFMEAYTEQSWLLRHARNELANFLLNCANKNITISHLVYMLPGFDVLLNQDVDLSECAKFKRRPRNVANAPTPPIPLRQALTILKVYFNAERKS